MAASDIKIADIKSRLLEAPHEIEDTSVLVPDWEPLVPIEGPPVEAAVLIALVRRDAGYSVLYTERSAALRSHSGQIAFPGGKIDPHDSDAAAAALREASEEVALVPADAEVIGYLPYYFSGTNYLITPVVAVVEPSAPFVPNPVEVQSLFEVPLSFIADAQNYGTFIVHRGNAEHETWKIEHAGRVIWGITAILTRQLRDIALIGEDGR